MSNKNPITEIISQANKDAPSLQSRMTIVLHPNTTRIDIVLNDRMFNTEKYYHSRKREPIGPEKEMLDMLEEHIIGIESARAGKNTVHLEISDGMRLREFMPQVITAVKQWGMAFEPGYQPEVWLENRRWEREPVYCSSDEWSMGPEVPGVRQRPDAPDIGVPYQIWVGGQ